MIKKSIKSFIPMFCTMCLGFSAFISAGKASFLFFGEPDYPMPTNEEN